MTAFRDGKLTMVRRRITRMGEKEPAPPRQSFGAERRDKSLASRRNESCP
jgi:hypothetical protein